MAKKFMAGLPEDEHKDNQLSSAPESLRKSSGSILGKYFRKLAGLPVSETSGKITVRTEGLPVTGESSSKKITSGSSAPKLPEGSVGSTKSGVSKLVPYDHNDNKDIRVGSSSIPKGSVGSISANTPEIPKGSVGSISTNNPIIPEGSTGSITSDKPLVPEGSVGLISDNSPTIPDGSVNKLSSTTRITMPEGSLGSKPSEISHVVPEGTTGVIKDPSKVIMPEGSLGPNISESLKKISGVVSGITDNKPLVPEGSTGSISDKSYSIPEGTVGDVSSTTVYIPEGRDVSDPNTSKIRMPEGSVGDQLSPRREEMPTGSVGKIKDSDVIVPTGSVGKLSDTYEIIPEGSVKNITQKEVLVPEGLVGDLIIEKPLVVPEGKLSKRIESQSTVIIRPENLKHKEGDVPDERSESGVLSEWQVPLLDKYLKVKHAVPEGSVGDYGLESPIIPEGSVGDLSENTSNDPVGRGVDHNLHRKESALDRYLAFNEGGRDSSIRLPKDRVEHKSLDERFLEDKYYNSTEFGETVARPDDNTIEKFDGRRFLDPEYYNSTEFGEKVGLTQDKGTSDTSGWRNKYVDANSAVATADSINSISNTVTSTVAKYESLLGKYATLGQFGEKAAAYVGAIFGGSAFDENQMVPKHHLKNLGALSLIRMSTQGTINIAMGATKQMLLDELILTAAQAQNLLVHGKTYSPALPTGFNTPGEKNWRDFADGSYGSYSINESGKQVFSQAITNDKSTNFGNALLDKVGLGAFSAADRVIGKQVVFSDKYIRTNAMYTTLLGLCDSATPVKSLDQLRDILTDPKNNITSSSKLKGSDGLVMTLDSNHVWEVVLEPYIGTDNGWVSFLPDISEINYKNSKQFGGKLSDTTYNSEYSMITNYKKWLPINSFELQYRRSNQRATPLFDGDIYYPTSLEFTNELRLTLIDDQFKSFKWYFNRCAEAAVYRVYKGVRDSDRLASNNDNFSVMNDTPIGWNDELVTIIDKTHYETAMYKNITFKCTIYVMSADYSTIEKFILLLVMRDHQIEYSGDTDAGGSDLSINFTIVGELTEDTTYDYDRVEASFRSGEGKIQDFRGGNKLDLAIERDSGYAEFKETAKDLFLVSDGTSLKSAEKLKGVSQNQLKELYKYQEIWGGLAGYQVQIVDGNYIINPEPSPKDTDDLKDEAKSNAK